jgi:hypothetical protein
MAKEGDQKERYLKERKRGKGEELKEKKSD